MAGLALCELCAKMEMSSKDGCSRSMGWVFPSLTNKEIRLQFPKKNTSPGHFVALDKPGSKRRKVRGATPAST